MGASSPRWKNFSVHNRPTQKRTAQIRAARFFFCSFVLSIKIAAPQTAPTAAIGYRIKYHAWLSRTSADVKKYPMLRSSKSGHCIFFGTR